MMWVGVFLVRGRSLHQMGALSQKIGKSTDTHLRGNKKLIIWERKNFDVQSRRSLRRIYSQLHYIKKAISEHPYVGFLGTEIALPKTNTVQGWRENKWKKKQN